MFFFVDSGIDSAKDETDLSEGYESNAEFEYEVDELSESEDIESHDTSSGTDVRNLY